MSSPAANDANAWLVQILLPMYNAEGKVFEKDLYDEVRAELMDRFEGLTAYVRSPATGLWKSEEKRQTVRDDVLLYEVVTSTFDAAWWKSYSKELGQRFQQETIMIRASQVLLL
jgi:hypothetical protein